MSHQTVELDVREDIKSGGSPCSRIMESASQLKEGDTLQLIAPFEPKPLYEVLGRQGFVHESTEIDGGDWEIKFTKSSDETVSPSPTTSSDEAQGGCGFESDEVVELDVRGLEPPQPMVRILDVLATLSDGASLRALTDRQPMLLFDQLALRGFRGETSGDSESGYVTLIRPL